VFRADLRWNQAVRVSKRRIPTTTTKKKKKKKKNVAGYVVPVEPLSLRDVVKNKKLTSSTKPEIHSMLQHRQRRTELQPWAKCTENVMKTREDVVPENMPLVISKNDNKSDRFVKKLQSE